MNADDALGHYEGWLWKTARAILSPSDPSLDDVVQEGRLALWNALETYDPSRGALPSWLVLKARYRMCEVAQGKPWTGQPPRFHGRQGSKEPEHMLSLDAPASRRSITGSGLPSYTTLADTVTGPDNTEPAELSYHDDEIRAALANLTPAQRRYVAARFGKGMTTAEMKDEVFGYDPSALWNSKSNGAKKKLRESLANMKSTVS